MAARLWTTGTELAHHTSQTLRPIAGSKNFAFVGYALYEKFFNRESRHSAKL